MNNKTLSPFVGRAILWGCLGWFQQRSQIFLLNASTLSASFFVIFFFQSFVWQGRFLLFKIHDQANLIALLVSGGLAFAACVSFLITSKHSFSYSRSILTAFLGLAAIVLFACMSWPVMLPPFFFIDLSKVFAFYIGLGLIPTVLVSLPQMLHRAGWVAIVFSAAIAILFLIASAF
jgi:hypothetical protein